MFKFAIFFAYLFIIFPIGLRLMSSEKIRDIGFMIMLIFTASFFAIHLEPIPEYKGTARGFAFTLVDFIAPMICFSLKNVKNFKFTFFPRGAFVYILYFIFSVVSVVNVKLPIQYGWEVWKMITMYLFFITVYNYVCHKKTLWPIFYTFIGMTYFIFAYGLVQKYILGIFQIEATFPHQNSLSMYMTVLATLFLGVLFNEKTTMKQFLLLGSAFVCASLLVFFSYSRGGIVCYGLGMATIVMTSLLLKFNRKKLMMSFIAIIVAVAPLLYMMPRLIDRFKNAPEASKTTRVQLAIAASRMANEHVFGVGLNNFSYYSGTQFDYNAEHFEKLKPEERDDFAMGGIVETIYLLVAAECGWVTFCVLILWFIFYYFLNIFNMFRYRNLQGFGVTVGIFGGLTAIYTQSSLEWVLKQFNNFYQLMFIFAIIAVMAHFLKSGLVSASKE